VWNQAKGVDSFYARNSCPTTAGIHCVKVHDAFFENVSWAGLTTMHVDANNEFVDDAQIVRI
jgi:hypothetical protein